MNRLLAGIFCSALILLGCWRVSYADGPYHGRVIDTDTKQPIQGAAVLAVWRKITPSIGHYMESIHDVEETVTDQDGNFTIPGTSTVSLISRIDEPLFTVFKPGYEAYRGWCIKAVSLPGKRRVYEIDGRTVLELGRLLTREERLENERGVSTLDCDRNEKCPNLIRLRNIERSILGFGPIGPVKMLRGSVPKADPTDLTRNAFSSSKPAIRQESTAPDFFGIWNALKDALRRGDIETALSFISVKSRERYRGIFTALGPQVSEIDLILTKIKPVAIRENDAEFEMLRSGRSFEVLFVRDEDGTWRVASF